MPLAIPQGSALAKEMVIRQSGGEYTVAIDSHVLLNTGVLEKIYSHWKSRPDDLDLYQGPNLHGWLSHKETGRPEIVGTHFTPQWGTDGMFGTWSVDDRAYDPNGTPFEIELGGTGFFTFKTSGWLGFNDQMRGFGAEEGDLHERYRAAGRRAMCHPGFQWIHRYGHIHGVAYDMSWLNRARNYLLMFREHGWPDFAGIEAAHTAEGRLTKEQFWGLVHSLGVMPAKKRVIFAGHEVEQPAVAVPAAGDLTAWQVCSRRGPLKEYRSGELCGTRDKKFPVFSCDLHGECGLSAFCSKSKVRTCHTCRDATVA